MVLMQKILTRGMASRKLVKEGEVDHLQTVFTSHLTMVGVYKSVVSANIYFFKGNSRNTRKKCEICLELKIKILFSLTSLWCFCC